VLAGRSVSPLRQLSQVFAAPVRHSLERLEYIAGPHALDFLGFSTPRVVHINMISLSNLPVLALL